MYIYIYMYMYMYMCIYIYIYIYNRHLGLINAPPLIFFFLQTTFVTIQLLSKWPNIDNILAKTLLIRREIPAAPSWGSSWGSSIFSQNETPPKVISCTYKVLIKGNTFWAPETRSTFGHPQDHPQDDSTLYFLCWIDKSFLVLVVLIYQFSAGPGLY